MNQNNAFFALKIEEEGTFLEVFPSNDGRDSVSLEDVMTYLSLIRFENYDKEHLMKELKTNRDASKIKLSEEKIRPVGECLSVTINDDESEAVVRFYPPSNEGAMLTKDDILETLSKNKVKAGIDSLFIDQWEKMKQYNEDFCIAQWIEPVEGKNAKIHYCFNTSVNIQPKINEDGSVDFHQLDNIEHIKAGDRLAYMEPAVIGKNGMTVTGKPIPSTKIKKQTMKHGRNITLSADGLTMYSEVSGHVYMIDGKVFVSNIYEVPADVDSSTGDIEFDGDIHVKGNVTTGYSLKSTGQIIVQGVVEGCTLEAGGGIVIVGGIQGGSRAVIQSDHTVTAKFIENATVTAGDDVFTEAIMHSHVTAGGKVKVEGKKGLIIGGEIHASESVEFKVAGSAMGAFTLIEVGLDPAVIEKYREIEERISVKQQEYKKLSQILTSYREKLSQGLKLAPDQIKVVKQIVDRVKALEDDYTSEFERRQELRDTIVKSNRGKVVVEDKVHSGVKIVISNAVLIVKEESHYCVFVKEGEDVRSKPM